METEAGGGEDARGNTDDAAAAKEGAGADVPAGARADGNGRFSLDRFQLAHMGGARHPWFFMLRPGLRILVLRGGEHPRRQADGFSIFTAAGGDSIRRMDGKQAAPMRFKRSSDYMGISYPYHMDWRVVL